MFKLEMRIDPMSSNKSHITRTNAAFNCTSFKIPVEKFVKRRYKIKSYFQGERHSNSQHQITFLIKHAIFLHMKHRNWEIEHKCKKSLHIFKPKN